MFRKELKQKLKDIFEVKKVTFDLPGDEIDSQVVTPEQEVLFVDIQDSKSSVKDGKVIARVEGIGKMYGPVENLTYGFIPKRIQQAGHDKTKDFFFYNTEENRGRFVNVIERTFRFRFFYSSQYDPEVGTMTSIDFEGIE